MKHVYIVLVTALCASTIIEPISLLIVDTHGSNRHHYRNIELLARSVGFNTTYKNLYNILENDTLGDPDAIFFICSYTIIAHANHNLAQPCWHALKSYIARKNKSVAFILPARPQPILHKPIMSILHSIGIQTPHLNQAIKYFTQPDTQHAHLFGTTLLGKEPNATLTKIIVPPTPLAKLTPHSTTSLSPNAKKTLPLGLLAHEANNNNIFLLSKLSLLSFAEIDENFMKNPFNLKIRQELIAAAQQTFLEFFQATQDHSLYTIDKAQCPPLPKELTLSYMRSEKKRTQKRILSSHYSWVRNGIKCAWLDPSDFATDINRGVQMLYNANFNVLWFEMLPEWFLSDHGRKKEERTAYIKHTKKLFAAFTAYAKKHKVKQPKVFLGLNLSSNFFNHPVTHPARNLFGKEYSKIPAPLDMHNFWQPEVLEIFDTFLATFKNVVPVDGVFLDFEMYHAPKQGGSFTDLMAFSDLSWQTYAIENKTAQNYTQHNDRIAYLRKHKLFTKYFDILERAAQKVGTTIKQHMRKHIPNLVFAAYAPTLPNSWFYRGITRGLSNKKEPLLYATFNTDYFSHHQWLAKHNIHLLHGSVAMLSKLKHATDFTLIDQINTYHDFIWYNRPSRMIPDMTPEERNKQWWGIESSPLSIEEFSSLVRAHP